MNRVKRIGCMLLTASVPVLFTSTRSVGAESAPGSFRPLFDGRTLSGWTQRGGAAKYTVENGMIVGTTVPNTSNSFLCTEKSYSDFVLTLEFKVDATLNSGVQIRSHAYTSDRTIQVKTSDGRTRTRTVRAGRVHGYQVEIDPAARAWTGGIYDEGRRGWLNSLENNEAARKAFKPGEWNRFRIEAIGDSIRTWINDVPAADLKDGMTPAGFIALQVHGVGKRTEKLQVRWRNIRIQDRSASADSLARASEDGFTPLFDGKTVNGWEGDMDVFRVEDGAIVGGSLNERVRRNEFLCTANEYGDFELRLKAKLIGEGKNAGIQFRSKRIPNHHEVIGYQFDMGVMQGRSIWGSLYDESRRRRFLAQGDADQLQSAVKPNDWNEIAIRCQGHRIQMWVNGYRTVDFRESDANIVRSGVIGVQIHGGLPAEASYKDIRIKRLTRE